MVNSHATFFAPDIFKIMLYVPMFIGHTVFKLLHGKSWIRHLHEKTLFELAASWWFQRGKPIYTWSFNEITINIFFSPPARCTSASTWPSAPQGPDLLPSSSTAQWNRTFPLSFASHQQQSVAAEGAICAGVLQAPAHWMDGNFGKEQVGWWGKRAPAPAPPFVVSLCYRWLVSSGRAKRGHLHARRLVGSLPERTRARAWRWCTEFTTNRWPVRAASCGVVGRFFCAETPPRFRHQASDSGPKTDHQASYSAR